MKDGVPFFQVVPCSPETGDCPWFRGFRARLVDLVQLPTAARVVDIAYGKGEFLIRLAEAYGVRGAGVDLSPLFIADAERRLRARVPQAGITFIQMDGADFKPDKPNSLTPASCIGASWVLGGHARTLDAPVGMAEPDGWVIVGSRTGCGSRRRSTCGRVG